MSNSRFLWRFNLRDGGHAFESTPPCLEFYFSCSQTQLFCLRKQSIDLFQDGPQLLGQRRQPNLWSSNEQITSQSLLHTPKPQAQRRLSDSTSKRRAGEVEFVTDCKKITNLLVFHTGTAFPFQINVAPDGTSLQPINNPSHRNTLQAWTAQHSASYSQQIPRQWPLHSSP